MNLITDWEVRGRERLFPAYNEEGWNGVKINENHTEF
jgi:hypothetical protein